MTDDDLHELERAGWRALSTSGDAARAFYAEHLADEVLFVLPGGLVIDERGRALDSMSGTPWQSFELRDERVVRLAPDSAVVAYRAMATRDGQGYQALVTSTWVATTNGWRLVAHQQTPL